MFLIIQISAYAIITFLSFMGLILLANFLIRPSLWTAFNIVMLIYFFFNIILGSLKIYMISLIISQNLEPLNKERDLGDVVADQLARYDKMEEACTIYVYWSGTALVREALLLEWFSFGKQNDSKSLFQKMWWLWMKVFYWLG